MHMPVPSRKTRDGTAATKAGSGFLRARLFFGRAAVLTAAGNFHNLKMFVFRKAKLQLGRSGRVSLWASAPEASGVKTPDVTRLFVGTEVPTSSSDAIVERQRLSNQDRAC